MTTDSLRRANSTDKEPLPDGKLFLENECLPLTLEQEEDGQAT